MKRGANLLISSAVHCVQDIEGNATFIGHLIKWRTIKHLANSIFRFKPILLTAIAAMIGAAVILFDPIFQGLAISLLFGLLSSTLLTVLVIPAIYVVLRD